MSVGWGKQLGSSTPHATDSTPPLITMQHIVHVQFTEIAAAAAEKRQARANAKEQKLAQDIEDAGKLYERMEAVGFDIQQFKDGQQPAILTLRPMTIVLVHKMGFEDDKKLNGKKREEILHLFQERVKRLYDAIPRPRRSLRNRA